jgi:BirA family biotin operon repressor/biotin-[acetyl-CoA-carboxylase] ligase
MLKDKILQILAETDGYASGEEISRQSQVSRTAVWKAIGQLRQEGFVIEAVPNRGYCLRSSVDYLDVAAAVAGHDSLVSGWEMLDSVDSTNNYLKRGTLPPLPHGHLVITEEQTAGRGRQGRQWLSSRRQGLWFSLLLRPQLAPSQAALLTMVAGLAVAEAINEEVKVEARIKWPNDVLLNGKKICGILTEMNAEMEQINYIILGIGINVSQPAPALAALPEAGSLLSLTGRSCPRTMLLRRILTRLSQRYAQWLEGQTKQIMVDWLALAAYLGEEVEIIASNGHKTSGIYHGVAPDGGLVLRTPAGEQVFYSGEVSLRQKSTTIKEA